MAKTLPQQRKPWKKTKIYVFSEDLNDLGLEYSISSKTSCHNEQTVRNTELDVNKTTSQLNIAKQ